MGQYRYFKQSIYKNMDIKKNTKLNITSGSYSDYRIYGYCVALKDFILEDEAASFSKTKTYLDLQEEGEDVRTPFLGYLHKQGCINKNQPPLEELWPGDYGSILEF